MNRISIKNVKFSEALSEETNAYVADVYLDNKKFGYAKNSGHGGMTDIRPYPNTRELYKEAEAYANGLGEVDFSGYTAKASLDLIVDDLLEKNLEAKLIKKLTAKGLVYMDKGSYKIVQWSVSMSKLLKHPKGPEMVKNMVRELRGKGFEVLNDNIPK